LPDLKIEVVYRKGGSGTTAIWTDYLSKSSARWKSQVGSGSKVEWPVGTAADKNDGVADAVSRTEGAIGYVELSFALANNLPVGKVKNKAGVFVEPSIESIVAAAASLQTIPDDLRYSLTDAPGEASYPIVGTAWAMTFVDQPPEKGRELARFLHWATTEGQAEAADLRYGRLPQALVGKAGAVIDRLTGAGQTSP
jgi:phosphate transport system substrate-binding protein